MFRSGHRTRLIQNIGDVYVCTDFEILEVKVPIIFLGTVGFSLRRDGRYLPTALEVNA